MRTLLQEIKKFRKLINLNEDFNSNVKSVIIGDGLVKYLEHEDFTQIKSLVDDNMTVNKLLNRLNDESEYIDVDHVFLSIGVNDKFSSDEEISFLVNKIKDVFPNATLQVIKGMVGGDYFYGGEEESDFESLEDESTYFYNLFFKNGVKVLGNYDTINYDLGYGDSKILQIKKEMDKSMFRNETDAQKDIEPQKVDSPFLTKNNKNIKGDDYTDYDTIYEFLDRFSKIVKSENYYDSRTSSSFKTDIEQIQIVLLFLNPSLDLDITGKFDTDTQEAVIEYQESQDMEPTGICDTETLEGMFYDLKIKGFDDQDLGMFLMDMGLISDVVSLLDGKVNVVGLSGEKEQNARIMIDYMNKKGIDNPYTQIGILCVIGKESGFIPQNEIGYGGTGNSRIREIFKNRVPSDDDELDKLKSDDEKFFNQVYGGMFGNSKTEGFEYRGRGFNGLTFKGNYQKYGSCIGRDLVSNPEVVNQVDIAAEVAVVFFTKCKSADQLPEFTNEDDAINYFVDLNAGGNGTDETRGNAFDQLNNFKIVA